MDLTNERDDAMNKNSHVLTKIMERDRAEYENVLTLEQEAFAVICAKHNEEA